MSGALKTVGDFVSTLAGANNPDIPQVTAPTPMPTMDSEAIKAARKKSIIEQQKRSGRQSTILSQGRNTLGN